MTVWCHLPAIIKQRFALRIAGLLSLYVALTTTLLFAPVSHATAGINSTLNFQGRLQYAAGGAVADGHYNIQFKIYQDGDGQTAGNSGGTLKWTETYINNGGTSGVNVSNGYFSVNLGSNNPFGSSVDWNQDTLWLSMNVAGSATACTTFNTSPCVADGEMTPMQRLTAVPYAINSSLLQGKNASNFVQLAQGVQNDASTSTSSIFINKTGSGNLLQLQNSGNDLLTLADTGNLIFGNSSNKTISVADSPASTAGKNLSVVAGAGGATGTNTGGNLSLQGGAGGGTNANGGNIEINAGARTGSGTNGNIYIGYNYADTIQIGNSSLSTGSQTINIGDNNTAGGTINVTIGTGGSSTGGATTIQSKDDTTIATNGTQRARFSGSGNTLYVGNANSSGLATTASSFTIQGTSSSGSNVQGGSISLIAGSATSGNANGGNLVLNGGAGSGTGGTGLVVLNTPTFQTATADANCYTSGSLVSSDCTITSNSVNNSGAVIVGFNAAAKTATLPDPTITTAGRILYVSAATGSSDFTLSFNAGGIGNQVILRANSTATMIWNGADWTAGGASNSTTLQTAYNNSVQAIGDATYLINATNSPEGLVVRNNESDQATNSLFSVQTSSAANLFSVNGLVEYAKDGGAEKQGGSTSTFPSNTWTAIGGGGATVTRYTTAGNNIGSGVASVKVHTGGTWSGTMNQLSTALTIGETYNITFSARTDSGVISDAMVYYSPDGTLNSNTYCTDYGYIASTWWQKISCQFTVPNTTITSSNGIFIGQNTAASRDWYIDNLSVTAKSAHTPRVQIGPGSSGGPVTLFTLDTSNVSPLSTQYDNIPGSMYYNTDLGKIQCYQAANDGGSGDWGACGSAPDNIITLSPEYTNAVMHGSGVGTMTSDFCSDALDINDGTSSQPTICGTNETKNYYNWTSSQGSAQSYSIYVTYKLPSTFKNFLSGSVSLAAKTDSNDASVAYQLYRNNGSGLTACGSSVSVATGNVSWTSASSSGGNDPSGCSFAAGESIVFKITATSANDANAYIGNLGFSFMNK